MKRVKKPYRGLIEYWRVHVWESIERKDIDEFYGKDVTDYSVVGQLASEPTLRFGPGPVRTSLVVKPFDPSELRKGMMIETLNSRYKLGAPA